MKPAVFSTVDALKVILRFEGNHLDEFYALFIN